MHSMNNCWHATCIHIIAGEFNGHVGEESVTFDTYHGDKDYDTRNAEGLKILDLCSATNLTVSNIFFDKNQSKFITFSLVDNNSDWLDSG